MILEKEPRVEQLEAFSQLVDQQLKYSRSNRFRYNCRDNITTTTAVATTTTTITTTTETTTTTTTTAKTTTAT